MRMRKRMINWFAQEKKKRMDEIGGEDDWVL
jgi:hypothetical protein